jgi:hypothetical protein
MVAESVVWVIRFISIDVFGEKGGASAAGEAVEQTLKSAHDALFVEPVVHLATLLADAHQAGATQDSQVVGDGRAAERDALSDVADVEFGAGNDLDQILTHRIGERDQQVAAERQAVAECPHLGIEGGRIDQTAHSPDTTGRTS